jgi:beta-lactamase regulating signal transducer with metallopeptidase domain
MTTILPAITDYVPYLLAAYGMGLLVMIARLARSVMRMRTITRTGVQQPDPKWLEYVRQWQERMGVMRQVRLLLTDRVDVPMMLGAIKPVILLPIATINNLSTAQVEAILLHELAHISRHDYVLNILQAVAEAVLFFNPFVWLVSGSIRKEREHCCDDLVVAACSNPMIYATALAQLEENRINDNSLTMAATGTDNQLLNRIKRIMEMKNTTNNRQTSVAVLVAAVVAATLLMGMIAYTPTWAQEKKKETKEVQKKTVIKTVTIDDNGTKKVVTKTATSVAASKEADTDDVRISVSVSDDIGDATAKVVVVNCKTIDIVGTDGKQPTTKVTVSKSIKNENNTTPIIMETDLIFNL